MLSYSPRRDIKFTLFTDSIAKMERIYESQCAKVIREYCSRWIVFPSCHMDFLKELDMILYMFSWQNKKDILSSFNYDNPLYIELNEKAFRLCGLVKNEFTYKERPINQIRRQLDKPYLFSIKDYVEQYLRNDAFSKIDKSYIPHPPYVQYDNQDSRKDSNDLDDLIKRIDAKIAELEAEEDEEENEEDKE